MRSSLMMMLLLALPATAGATTTPPVLRLPDGARPTRYGVELTIDPSREQLSGAIDIDLAVAGKLDVLWLNATDLTIRKVKPDARVIPGGKDFVGLAFQRALPAGPARVHIEYTGPLSSRESSAASRQKEGDDWYVFTQFEPIDARRVFPCFDEPAYKTPWQLALRVRAGDRAFANTPQLDEKKLEGGWKRVQFAESKPLPSYLVAFAVGPIDVVDGGRSARSGTPVRILVPRGQGERAAWAAEVSHRALELLEEYFDAKYPYEKLDCIAVPLFGGAMENPGLVTFGSSLILQKPGEETLDRKRAYAQVAIHEFAHQWFGDLVTTAWWDDLWLNEAFATWMTPKVIEGWQPSWGAAEQRVGSRGSAMSADSLVSARKIRQPIASNHDIKNAFDGITYQKGATVIGMFERYVGPDVFRRGVQRYLREHAHQAATAADFLRAVSAEAKRDIAPAFSSFLDQPGVPAVSFDLRCDDRPRLHLTQARYLPRGSPGGGEDQLWQVPVCARWPEGRGCMVLGAREGDLPLAKCPAWVEPVEGGGGYYRALPAGDLLARMERALPALSPPEKLALMSDLDALSRAGHLELSALLELLPRLAADRNRFVVQAAAGTVASLEQGGLISEAQRPAFARFVRDLFGGRARQLGWKEQKGEDEDTRLLRTRIVPLVADEGEDGALVAQARKLASAWLADHRAIDADLVEPVLSVAARHGDRALFEAWMRASRAEKDRAERRRLLSAMAGFRDPAIVSDALALVAGDTYDVRESMALFWGAAREIRTNRLAWDWLQKNFDALAPRLPRDAVAQLPASASGLCDEKVIGTVRSFFGERAARYEGGPRRLDQAVEQMHLCAAYREAQAPSVTRFLAGRR